MKPLKIISLYEIEYEQDAWEWLDLEDDEHFETDPMTLFEGDPDMINIFGDPTCFMDFETDENHYVIVSGDVSDVEDYLERFFSDDFQNDWELTEPNDWDSFWHNEEKNETIAYRGGRGYVYTVWQFINNQTTQ